MEALQSRVQRITRARARVTRKIEILANLECDPSSRVVLLEMLSHHLADLELFEAFLDIELEGHSTSITYSYSEGT